MTDDHDRRCLLSVLRQFISPAVAGAEGAALCRSGTYRVPPDSACVDAYRDAIRLLPRCGAHASQARPGWEQQQQTALQMMLLC